MQLAELKEILGLLQGFVFPILGYGIYLLSDIRGQLVKLNSRIVKLESWTESHETLDNERTILIRKSVDECSTRITTSLEPPPPTRVASSFRRRSGDRDLIG